MIRRSSEPRRILDIPTSGPAKEVLGDNPRRVGLRLQSLGVPNVLLYRKADPVDVATGWRLATADGPMVFEGRDSCPRGPLFVGGSGAGAELQVYEVTEEDTG